MSMSDGGNGTGGVDQFPYDSDGSIGVDGGLYSSADGYGGDGQTGGDGYGGYASIYG